MIDTDLDKIERTLIFRCRRRMRDPISAALISEAICFEDDVALLEIMGELISDEMWTSLDKLDLTQLLVAMDFELHDLHRRRLQ
jgi:hypothetical protein